MNEIVGASLVLALVTAAEGIRRGGSDTVVLRRFAFGRWRLAANAHLGAGLHLASLCAPLSLPLIVATEQASSDSIALRRARKRAETRIRRTRVVMALLRINGLAIVALVVGLPFAAYYSDVFGLVAGVAALIVLCFAQATFQLRGMRRAGARVGVALAASARSLWPFSAPSAPTRLQTQVFDGVPGLAAMHLLLGRDAFLDAVRPLAYDALRRPDALSDLLFAVVDRQSLSAFIRAPSGENAGDPFCPRCGLAYRAGVAHCADCPDVALMPA